MSQQSFTTAVTELLSGIEKFTPELGLPGFILLYTSIDIVASLTRPATHDDTAGDIFKAWVRDYLLPCSGLSCNEEDLWGARCGLLHTFTVQSRRSRQGAAREIHYVGDVGFCNFLNDSKNQHYIGAGKVVVVPAELGKAFTSGIERFVKKLQTDQTLAKTVYDHSAKLIQHGRARIKSNEV
jgi:hypothetical protein